MEDLQKRRLKYQLSPIKLRIFKFDFFSKFIVFLFCYVSLVFSAESRLASLNFCTCQAEVSPGTAGTQRAKVSSESGIFPCVKYLWHRMAQVLSRDVAVHNRKEQPSLAKPMRKTFPSTHDFRLPGLLDWRLGKGVFQNLPNYQIWLTSLNMYRLRLHTATAVSVQVLDTMHPWRAGLSWSSPASQTRQLFSA